MSQPVEHYVSRSLRADAWIDAACAAGALAGGLVILAVTYSIAFVIVWLLIPARIANAVFWAHVGGGAFVALAFIENQLTQRKLFEAYVNEPSTADAFLRACFIASGFQQRDHMPLAPGVSRNLVRVAADFLCSGPRLLASSVRMIRRARARSSADIAGCARVLSLALGKRGRVSFLEITDSLPDLDLPRVLEQLTWLGGVVFLRNDPPGLTLTESLRETLEGMDPDRGPGPSGPSGMGGLRRSE